MRSDSAEDIERQRVEWEAYSTKELLEGRCPYAGEELEPVMDWWNRRVLMCPNCDCFGYPLVMSDFNPDEPVDEAVQPTGDLTDGELYW